MLKHIKREILKHNIRLCKGQIDNNLLYYSVIRYRLIKSVYVYIFLNFLFYVYIKRENILN